MKKIIVLSLFLIQVISGSCQFKIPEEPNNIKEEQRLWDLRKMEFAISGAPYIDSIYIYINPNTQETVEHLQTSYGLQVTEEEIFEASGYSFSQGGLFVIWLYDHKSISTLSHEVFHTTVELLRRAGLTLSSDSEEAYAYQIAFITKQIIIKYAEIQQRKEK